MSSGGKPTQTTTQTNDPPAWAVPYFQQGLEQASAVSKQPYTAYQGQRVAGYTDDQLQSMDMVTDRATRGSDAMRGANAYITDTLDGSPNPYTDQMVDQVTGDITRNYRDAVAPSMMAQFNSAGAYGGSAQQQAMQGSQNELAGQLGDAATKIRSGAYESDQARRMAAAQFAPQLAEADYADAGHLARQGSGQQQMWQSLLDQDHEDFTEERDWASSRLNALSPFLAAVQGGTVQSTGANPQYRSAGQNAAGYAALLASMWGGG